MSTVKRTIIANPERTSVETWSKIVEIICSQNSNAKKEFKNVSNVIASLLSEELLKDYPMIMKGSGSQLRVYCLYGEDAISGEDANEEQLSWDITAKEWKVFLPCPEDQIKLYEKVLNELNDKFKVYDINKGIDKDEYNLKENKTEFKINEEEFKKI